MHGLSKDFLKDLLTGELKGFLAAVQNDDTLCLEIRDKYVNIYYRGGNLCRIIEVGKNFYKFETVENYAKTSKNKDIVKRFYNLSDEEKPGSIHLLKSVIDEHGQPFIEKEIQQFILRENNCSNISKGTDYFIADIEYQNNENNSRFDMVGIKWPPRPSRKLSKKNLKLSLIEVKYGDGKLTNGNGLLEHFQDMMRYITNPQQLSELCNEMTTIFNQKVKLGLFHKSLLNGDVFSEIENIANESPELIFLIANHQPASTKFLEELKRINKNNVNTYDVKIATSSPMGYGLYEKFMVPIDEYISQSKKITGPSL